MVTSRGASATRWIAFVLASNPETFAAHGHFAIDSVVGAEFKKEKSKGDSESLSIGNAARDLYDENNIAGVFAAYRNVKPTAHAYGNVHSYTLDGLMRHYTEDLKALPGLTIANVIRHPVSYIESHVSLVHKAEEHPDVYRAYSNDMFPKALRAYPELFLVDCPDFREFFAFVTSCLSALDVASDLAYKQVRHFRMEALTTEVETLAEFCRSLTGLDYDLGKLREFIEAGAINRHRKSSAGTDELALYQAWPAWKRDIAAMMISSTALARLEEAGYAVGMLRDGFDQPEETRSTAPSLADRLKEMDKNHPYLAVLRQNANASRRGARESHILGSLKEAAARVGGMIGNLLAKSRSATSR
jgi:hypothetical protein